VIKIGGAENLPPPERARPGHSNVQKQAGLELSTLPVSPGDAVPGDGHPPRVPYNPD